MNGPMRAWAEKIARESWLTGRAGFGGESRERNEALALSHAVVSIHNAAPSMPSETTLVTIEQMAAALRDYPDADFSHHVVRAEEVLAFVGARDTTLAQRLASLVGQHSGKASGTT